MIEWIKTWTEEIIIAVIISIIIEMLMPDGNNKKYVKVVSGIYILYTIINPFLGTADSFKSRDLQVQITNNNIIQTSSDSTVATTYIVSLEEYLKNKIESLGYEVKEVEIICDSNYNDILKIDVKMKSVSFDENSIKDVILNEYEIELENILIS